MRSPSAVPTLLALLLLGASPGARAGEGSDQKPRAKAKKSLDLGLSSSLGEIPKADGLVAPGNEKKALESAPSASASYEVVGVRHARAFVAAKGAANAVSPIDAVKLSGNPPTTEKFSTAVRVKCPQKASAPIEVVILDPRSDTVMSASGQLSYTDGEEAEYLIDWDPTPLRMGGEYHVLVRVAGQPMGTWALKIASKG